MEELIRRVAAEIAASLPAEALEQLRADVQAAALAEVRQRLQAPVAAALLTRLAQPTPPSATPSDEAAPLLPSQPLPANPAPPPSSEATVLPSAAEPLLEVNSSTRVELLGEDACYVYAIVRADATSDLPGGGFVAEQGLFAVVRGDIAAICSYVPLDEFGPTSIETSMADPVWLERAVLIHQRTIAELRNSRDLVPLRFGTIFLSEQRVATMLDQYYVDFETNLARLSGCDEWGIKLLCEAEVLSERVAETNSQIQTLDAEIARKSEGAAFMLRKQRDRALAAEVERLSDECASRSHSLLSASASASGLGFIHDRELTAPATMLLNGVYLVAREHVEIFMATYDELRSMYEPLGFHFALTGPWPAYSFATVARA